MGKRKFTADYKTKLVLEMLREEQHISEISSRENISRTQLQNWKKEFLDNAVKVFSDSKAAKETAYREREQAEEKAAMLKTIGQLTLERDFLQEQVRKKDFQVYLRRNK